jgi:flagellar hook-length control protein FliK
MDFRPVAKMKGKEGPQSPFEAKLAVATKLSQTAGARAADPTKPKSEVPQTLPKPVVDQIAQYVQLVVRKDGEKELDITLHEKVFRGLRLRAAVVRGKVEATFLTSNPEVRDLFNSQKVALRQALAEKGFDVREIHVIMAT